MPYTLKVTGMEEIGNMFEQLAESAPSVASKAVYKGAGMMAEAIRKRAEKIRTGPGATREDARYATPEEKEALLSVGVGIAKFDKNGSEVQTSVGYSNTGYAVIKGRVKPIPLIANAINSGTSFMHKQPFVRNAARNDGKKVSAAMKEVVEDEFTAIINNKTGGNET